MSGGQDGNGGPEAAVADGERETAEGCSTMTTSAVSAIAWMPSRRRGAEQPSGTPVASGEFAGDRDADA